MFFTELFYIDIYPLGGVLRVDYIRLALLLGCDLGILFLDNREPPPVGVYFFYTLEILLGIYLDACLGPCDALVCSPYSVLNSLSEVYRGGRRNFTGR